MLIRSRYVYALSIATWLSVGMFCMEADADDMVTKKALQTLQVGFNFGTGGAVIESATKALYRSYLLFSIGVDVGIEPFLGHRFSLTMDYFRPMGEESGGSEQIRVKNRTRFLNPVVVYSRLFKFVSISVGIGPSLAVVTTTTQLFDLGTPSIDIEQIAQSMDARYQFPNKTLIEEQKETGVNAGILALLGFSVDVGKAVGAEEDFFQLKLLSYYARRSEHNEVFILGTLAITPTALIKR